MKTEPARQIRSRLVVNPGVLVVLATAVGFLGPEVRAGSESALIATYLGGTGEDTVWDLGVLPSGDVVVVGTSSSPELRLEDGTTHTPRGFRDVFVARLTPTLSDLVSMTVLAGSSSDMALRLAVGKDGTVAIGGYTESSDFPVTETAFGVEHRGWRDVFIAVVDTDPDTPREDRVLYATMVGGSGEDVCVDIDIDGDGALFAAGFTNSPDFPTVEGAYSESYNGGAYDAFLLRIDPDPEMDPAEQLTYASFVGGWDADSHPSNEPSRLRDQRVVVDHAGTVTMAGLTMSTNFPLTDGAFDTSHNGGRDAYVVQFLPDVSLRPEEQLVYGTLLGGGKANEAVDAVAIDPDGNIVVAGWTWNPGFPTTTYALSRGYGGACDGYLSVIKPDLSLSPNDQLLYSTFLGNWGGDYATDLFVAEDGRIYIVGGTQAHTDFPITDSGARSESFGTYDGFLAVMELNDATESAELLYSTYLGGTEDFFWVGDDIPHGVALANDGIVFVASWTTAQDLPAPENAYQAEFSGDRDAVVHRVSVPLPRACIELEPENAASSTPFEVTLDSTCSTTTPSTSIASHHWNLGDGDTSDLATLVHTYTEPGRYQISLEISNDADLTHTQHATATALCPPGDLGEWSSVDVGDPMFPGAARIEDAGEDCLEICAGNRGIRSISTRGDGFFYVFEEVTGDFDTVRQISSIVSGEILASVGVLCRESFDGTVAFAATVVESLGDDGVRFRYRLRDHAGQRARSRSGDTETEMPVWVRLKRRGSEFTSYGWKSSERRWHLIATETIDMPATVLLGVAAWGRDPERENVAFQPIQARVCEIAPPEVAFIRGDCNGDGNTAGVADALQMLTANFTGGVDRPCLAACDTNGDGDISGVQDALELLTHNFVGGVTIPEPFPECEAGSLPTDELLGCDTPACR